MVALATGRGQEQAAAELAAAMDDGFPPELRPTAVQHLADLHHRLGRPLEERRLLERELARPELAGSPQRAELADRLAAIRAGSDLLAEAFAAWQARFPLPILAVAEPAALADPRLTGPGLRKGEAQMLEGDWLPPEKVKIAFLLAAAAQRPPEARAAALAAVLPELRSCLPRQGAYRAMLLALAEERRFPPQLRAAAAFWHAYSWLQHENLPAADAFLARGDLGLAPRQREMLAALRALPAAKAAGSCRVGRPGGRLRRRAAVAFRGAAFPEAWRYLALLGPADAAAGLAAELAGLGPAEAAAARGQLPDLAALRRLRERLRTRLGEGPAERPALLDEVASPQALESLAPTDCRTLLRWDLHHLGLGLAATPGWPAAFAGCQDSGEEGGRMQAELVLVVADSELADADKANALLATAGYLADDDPAWPGLLASLGARRARLAAAPRSREALRLLEVQRALRRGGHGRSRGARRRGLAGPPPGGALLADAGPAPLRRCRPPPALSWPRLAPDEQAESARPRRAARAARRCSPGPERAVVQAAARRQLYLEQLGAYANHSWSAGRAAIRLAAALGEPPPPGARRRSAWPGSKMRSAGFRSSWPTPRAVATGRGPTRRPAG